MFRAEDVRARVRKEPFVPFRIVTSSGESYEVHHPELILIGQGEVTVGRPSTSNPAIHDGFDWVAIMHITAMNDMPAHSPQGGNGQPTQ